MNMQDKNDVQKQTEEAKQQAMKEAHDNKQSTDNSDPTIHTINPFTGTKVDISPEDLEGMEKLNEANTERD